ncbi:unnamed protein product [Rhizoctonia solani]|uniref:Polysaccharide lyase 14 domain-containing protein n=1 Tax=Rhizoctonia solani TaxID=456999 RepID=A0A8H3I2J0_9AGAM|nr:unnamed protein product [Rhizoctonia solani]CAE7179089.1 unnamed protein product [Rhizoctonia solani]
MLDKIKAKLHLDSDDKPASGTCPVDPAHLFPLPILAGFSTHPHCPAASTLALTDSALGIQKSTPGFSRRTVQIDALDTYEALFPEGSINPQGAIKGGFGCYLERTEFERARDVVFAYSVKFEDGFDFVKGGKLPGLYGGSTPELAYGCSGGRQDGRDKCFNLRLMWRPKGAGEIYTYLPNTPANQETIQAVPKTHCNPDFGWSVARGSFRFKPGEWTTIAERVRLNDVGCANGVIQLWANGELVVDIQGLEIRVDEEVVFRGAHFQTFFGGKGEDWASTKDQRAYFGAVSGGVVEWF